MTLGNDNGTDGQTECDAICDPLLGTNYYYFLLLFNWPILRDYSSLGRVAIGLAKNLCRCWCKNYYWLDAFLVAQPAVSCH